MLKYWKYLHTMNYWKCWNNWVSLFDKKYQSIDLSRKAWSLFLKMDFFCKNISEIFLFLFLPKRSLRDVWEDINACLKCSEMKIFSNVSKISLWKIKVFACLKDLQWTAHETFHRVYSKFVSSEFFHFWDKYL